MADNKRPTPPEFVKTLDEAAEKLGVSRQSFTEWKRSSDFPKPTKRGWNLAKVRAWCKDHARGPYRRGAAEQTAATDKPAKPKQEEISLYEANRRKRVEEAENERIKKERQLVEQAKELKAILSLEDVQGILSQMIATARAVADSLQVGIDRALPEAPPSPEAWPDIRARVMGMAERLDADLSAAMDLAWS